MQTDKTRSPRRVTRIVPLLMALPLLLTACGGQDVGQVVTAPCPQPASPPVALQRDPPTATAQTDVKPFLLKASDWSRRVADYFGTSPEEVTQPPNMPASGTNGR